MDWHPVQGEIETFPVVYTTETWSNSHSMSSSTKSRVKWCIMQRNEPFICFVYYTARSQTEDEFLDFL